MTALETLTAFFDVVSRTGALRIVIVGTILLGLWLGLVRAGFAQSERTRTWLAAAVPLLAWFALTWAIAPTGVFQVFPVLPLAIVVPVVIGLVLVTRSHRIAAALDIQPPSWLIGLQVYRVFGGVFLVQWRSGSCRLSLHCRLGSATCWSVSSPCRSRFMSRAAETTAAPSPWAGMCSAFSISSSRSRWAFSRRLGGSAAHRARWCIPW